jgi:hypothetical protein
MNKISFLPKALTNLGFNGECLSTDNEVTDWLGHPPILQTAITAEISRLQGIYDSQEYARARATAYSALNQFEMQFDDQQNNTTTWVDAINDIKARFPK